MESAPRPPSPPTFRSRVKRYTEDTRNVAAWLRQTALNCGYAASTASSSAESCNAKKAEYLIKTSEFIPMAEAIAAHKPQPIIPQDVLATISRAIRLRRRETRYVKLFGAKCRQSQLGDSTHTHFTERVLGKVRDVLRPIVQPTAPEPQTTTTPSLSEKLASIFGSETDEADDISDEPFNNLTPVYIDFDDVEVEDEFFLAIDAFMEDVFVMRQYVEYIWTMYKESVLENNVCSLLTNTAIDVVRLAENEFAQLIKRPKRFPADKFPVWTLPALLFYKRTPTLDERFTYEEFSGLMPIKLLRKDVQDQSDFALFSVFSGLKWYLYTTPEQGPCTLDPARFRQSEENWHPHLPRVVEMCQMMQWQAEIQYSPEFGGFPDGVAEDEIARGVRHIMKHREIPIWVQFATQTYMDIQDVLGSHIDAPLKELHERVMGSRSRLDEFLSNNLRVDNWDLTSREQFTKPIGSLVKSQESLELWLTQDAFKKSLAKSSPPHLSKFKRQDNALLRRHPLGCGVLQYNMFANLHKYGLELERNTDCIRPMIYLYAAVRLLFEEEIPAWPDMELLILRQESKRLFFGKERPADYQEIFQHFEWAFGEREQNPCPDRVQHIVDPSMLTDIFHNRFNHRVENSEEIDPIVSKWAALISSEEGMTHILRQMNFPPDFHRQAIEELQKQTKNNKPDAVLNRLSTCLETDAIDLHFDWLALHNKCAELWVHIYVMLVECRKLIFFNPEDFRKTPHPQVGLTRQILLESAQAYNATQNLALEGPGSTYGHSLRIAASLLRQTIITPLATTEWGHTLEGDVCLRATMLQASDSQKLVHYPGAYYMFSGPAHTTELYKGRNMAVLGNLHTVRLATACHLKLEYYHKKRNMELRQQLDEDEVFRKQAANVEQKDSEQGSSAQKSTKKPKNQKKKKKGKGTTF